MSSTMSLDSLSSPSPSPEPEPEALQPAPDAMGAGLDTDSELSELTEEEQEAEKQKNYQRRDENGYDSRPRRSSRRGGAVSTRSEWGKRRKGDHPDGKVVEEEEEEEMSGPPKAMEEEEEEDEEDDSAPPSRPRENGIEDEDEDEDDAADGDDAEMGPLADAADEEDYLSGDDEPNVRVRRSRRAPRTPPYQDGDLAYPLPAGQTNAFDYEEDDDDLSDPPTVQPDENVDSDNDNVTESDDDDAKDELPVITKLNSSSKPLSPSSKSAKISPTLTSANIDLKAPPPHAVAPLASVAAASSIMAGSSVIDPPSPSSSSASGSAASSRSPSPAIRASIKTSKQADGDGPLPPKRDAKRKLSAADKHADMLPLADHKLDVSNAASGDLDVPEPDGSVEDLGVDEPLLDPDAEMDPDLELQPAHRAEALDVLATIELKFSLLREKVYVEKMEGLAWEEALIAQGSHPELIHLQAELSKRRDKRLELASRKRMYETASVTKKLTMDEAATWSWWKFTRDELQKDMISETNRKRRKLERERRAVERPQPVRRIPKPPHDTPIPPTLRKIVKASLFGRAHSSRSRRGHRPLAKVVYPALGTLPTPDIAADLNYLFHNRRSSFETQRLGNMHINNTNPQVGMQPSHGYEPYSSGPGLDGLGVPPSFGGLSTGNRMPPPPTPPYLNQHQPLSMPGLQPPPFPSFGGSGSSRQPLNLHSHNGPSQFALEPEMAPIASGSGSGPAPFPSHHTYFGSAQGGIGVVGPAGHVFPNPGGHTVTRRSISPVPVLPNGLGGSAPGALGGKPNGGWIGVHHSGGKQPGSNEWMGEGRRNDMVINDMEDERRDGLRSRDNRRDKDRMRERSERERERESHELDREHERERTYHGQQQQQHRHPPPVQHQHAHAPTGQGPHGSLGQHHHHHHHHHHVLHHHHPNTNTGGSSTTTPGPGTALSPRGVTSREFEISSGPSSGSRPTEVINLSSKPPVGSNWKGNDLHAPSSEYRESRKLNSRPSSGPPVMDERERTLAMPFVMSSTYGTAGNGSSTFPPTNGTLPAARSPRSSWNSPEDGGFRIPASSSGGYLGSADGHGNSPGHRYASTSSHLGRGAPPSRSRQGSTGLSPPRPRTNIAPSPSPSSSAYVSSARSPTRFGPPPCHTSGTHSPILKARGPGSPMMPGKLSVGAGSGTSGVYSTSTPSGVSPGSELKGVGGTSVSGVGNNGSRAGSPLLVPHGSQSGRSGINSNGVGHGVGEDNAPGLGLLTKMTVAQMVEGR